MKYFEDLLESYSKLKKRTFKLQFISESMDPTQQAIGILQKVAVGPAFADIPELGNKFRARISKDGSIAVLDLSMQRQSNLVDPSGQRMEENNTAKQIWENIFKYLSGGEDSSEKLTPEAEAERQAQAARAEAENRVGGSLEMQGLEVTAPLRKALMASYDHLSKFITNLGDLPSDTDPSLANLAQKPMAYVAGASRFGFEYKLANSQAVQLDENGKSLGIGPANEGLIESAAEANAILTSFLAGEGDCGDVADRIGKYKNKLVLFGTEKSEALVVKPNTMHNVALQKVNDECGDIDFTSIVEDQVSEKAKNAVKGTFYEDILQLTHELVSATESEEQLNAAFKRVAAKIQEKKDILLAIALDHEIDVATDLDVAFERDVIEEQLGISQDEGALRDFIFSEIKASAGFVKLMDADGVMPTGKSSGTGNRADTVFTYADEEKAKAAAKFCGSEAIWDRDTESWIVGVGQKRLQKLKTLKMGEINSKQRMNDIMNEDAPVDKDLAAGFYKKIDDMQGLTAPQKSNMRSYHNRLEQELKAKADLLTKDSTYIDANGDIKANSAQQNLEMVSRQLSDLYTYEELLNTPLGKAIIGEDKDFRDFSDPRTRARAAELLTRQERFRRYKKDLGKRECRDAIMRQAIICGGNATGLSQLIVDDTGNSWAYSTNELFETVMADPNMKITPAGDFGVTIEGGGLSLSWTQEGTWAGGDNRETRSQTKVSKDSIVKLNRLPKKAKNEDNLMLQFLRGQQRLLEDLINQTNNSFLL